VPGKYLAKHFGLWLDLPTWDMRDKDGTLCSIATTAGESSEYEHLLFLKQDLLDGLLASQQLALCWDVWGERQHFGERHTKTNSPSHGYEFFRQIYRYSDRKITKLL
jgi:hypothetical protein